MKWFAMQQSNAAERPVPRSVGRKRVAEQPTVAIRYLSMVTVQMRCGAFKIRRRVSSSCYNLSSSRQPCGLRCRNRPLRRADNLVPAALWLADYWACLCVASGQKPSALLEKSHEKIMRRVATTASPSESRAANRDLGLCFLCSSSMFISIICDGLDDRP